MNSVMTKSARLSLVLGLLAAALLLIVSPPAQSQTTSAGAYPLRDDVTWTTLGSSDEDSMPVGNGDIAANVWTEQNGDLVLLIAKSDA